MGKVLGEPWSEFQDFAVCGDSNAFDVLMVVSHKLHMLDEGAEALPPWERWSVDQHADKPAIVAQVWIDGLGNPVKVVRRQRAVRTHNEHALEKLELDHGALAPSIAQPRSLAVTVRSDN